ncbi:recombinase family protein [Heyndrickxia sporothermodurans]|uniref:recombinase family protein n=1 Tax=Heyndrickxia sporothermodurans TaxID=46224 RepID=UPI002E1F1B44|nr:recombinase family protein [Heyndrickxia sporothermodurans]
MKIGYSRCSSISQNLERQLVALKDKGVEKIFAEKISGKNMERPQLKEMLNFVREGDVIIIESISRLARNTLDFLTIVRQLNDKKVEIISLKESLDTSTPQGKFMLTVFGALYELERDSIRQRQAEGIAVAKANGTQFGRPKVEVDDEFLRLYKLWKRGKITVTAISKELSISRATFYRRVNELEEENN